MRVLLLVAALAALAAPPLAASVDVEHYRGYKLLTATPKDEAQVGVVRALGAWRDVDLFTHRVVPGADAVLMVPPASLPAAQRVLADKGVQYDVTNHDVQESVNDERDRQHKALTARAHTAIPTFQRYMRYAEIATYLQQTAKSYPNLVTLMNAGKTYEGRDMLGLRISTSGGKSRRGIIVDAGIHAREWISPPVAIYLIQQLTEHQSANSALLADLDWYIMPVANPDGYEYTHTRERFWRKNRSTKNSRWCPGTDLNRNFGYHYRESGASDWPCDETYAGPSAFSEIESANIRDWILQCNAAKNVKVYLTFHSYGPMILYPWGYANDIPPADDTAELLAIANEANDAMIKAGSEKFEVQNSAGLYPAAGASDDWSKGVADIPKAYTIELPPGGKNGFDMPANRIVGVVQSVFEGIKVFAAHAKLL
ncbi:carboxypeptidase B-like [Thrips palmi]|uniref:Carboxypeptidase B-like n=1 Tax=Thrips palmi TaxID=161013 RepID=A0A6P8ZCR2_THRPL|nr:carboxypeptidase B-like [Thrips palmi]